jgi:hypothetical protein
MSAVQFFLNLDQLKEYVTRFYNNGMDDLEVKRNLEEYEHFIVQFQFEEYVERNLTIIIEEVWGMMSEKEDENIIFIGERLAHFEYDKLEFISDALLWLKEKDIPFSIYEYER